MCSEGCLWVLIEMERSYVRVGVDILFGGGALVGSIALAMMWRGIERCDRETCCRQRQFTDEVGVSINRSLYSGLRRMGIPGT